MFWVLINPFKEDSTMRQALAIRVDETNPDHHLWNNHGIWWIHYTLHPTPWTQKRVRQNLGTRSVEEARRLRDALFARIADRGVAS
jgi:hypothetical protein